MTISISFLIGLIALCFFLFYITLPISPFKTKKIERGTCSEQRNDFSWIDEWIDTAKEEEQKELQKLKELFIFRLEAMKKFDRMSPEEQIKGIEELTENFTIFKSSLIEILQKMKYSKKSNITK